MSAAWEIGLLDELADGDRPDVRDSAASRNAQLGSIRVLRAILAALGSREVVVLDAARTMVARGLGFEEAFEESGFLYGLTRGCGELFTDLSLNGERANRVMHAPRPPPAISAAYRTIAWTFFDPPLRELLAGTCRSTGVQGPEPPMFTVGVEAPHAIVDERLPTFEESISV